MTPLLLCRCSLAPWPLLVACYLVGAQVGDWTYPQSTLLRPPRGLVLYPHWNPASPRDARSVASLEILPDAPCRGCTWGRLVTYRPDANLDPWVAQGRDIWQSPQTHLATSGTPCSPARVTVGSLAHSADTAFWWVLTLTDVCRARASLSQIRPKRCASRKALDFLLFARIARTNVWTSKRNFHILAVHFYWQLFDLCCQLWIYRGWSAQ